MKKKLLALLLTLCMVVSLLPAQMVVAEGTTATVTILGNSKTVTLCDRDGLAVAGPDMVITVSVPVGSTLGNEGYCFAFENNEEPLGWTCHPDTALATTADVLAYPIAGDTTFEAGWPGAGGNGNNQGGNDALLVALDGYHGDASYGGGKFTLSNGSETDFCVWEWASEGQTIAQATGISSMLDPWWDGMDFEGWLLYREDGDPFNGPSILTLESQNLISTADMLAATVPGYSIRYVAKWAQIDWEYYENIYDPYYGVGGEGGEDGSYMDLGEFPLDTPTTVSVEYDWANPVSGAVATFTPAESGYYSLYQIYPSDEGYQWMNISANLNGTYVDMQEWYAYVDDTNSANGFRWYFEAGNTYQLVFDGTTWGGGITYTLKKVVAPTAIVFPEGNFDGFVGSGDMRNVEFEPFYAYADVTYAIADTTVADFTDYGGINYLKAGTTTITARCGDLEATAQIKVSDPITLTLGTAVTNTTGGTRLRYNFTPAESGEYIFDFSPNVRVSVGIENANENMIANWSVNAGGRRTNVVELTGGKTYIVWVIADEANLSATAKVTAGNDRLTLTEGTPLALNLPAKSSVTAVFEAGQGDYVKYITHWANKEGLENIEVEMLQVQDGGYGYFGTYDYIDLPNAYGCVYEIMGGYTYHVVITNPTDAAVAFDFTLQQPVADTAIQFRDNLATVVCVDYCEYPEVIPVNPAGQLNAISWHSSNESVATVSTGDHTRFGYVEFFAEGEVTITATNTVNDSKTSHTYYVVPEGAEDNLALDANGGEMELTMVGGDSFSTNWFSTYVPAGQGIKLFVKSISGDPVHPAGVAFEGWLPHIWHDGEPIPVDGAELLSTAEALAYPVADQRIILIAMWEGNPGPGFEIPEDATVTDMVKDTKYDVPAGKDVYFTFTAPADGVYSLNTDASMGVNGECYVWVSYFAEGGIFDGQNMSVSLKKDQKIEIQAGSPAACKLWVAKENAVTKMEIVSQDKTTSYLVDAAMKPFYTLKDVDLKLTYEDGTTETVNGGEMYPYEYMPYYNGMPLSVDMVIGSTTADVTFHCANTQVQYTVNLDDAMVVKMEAIPAEDMVDFHENTMGEYTDGVYVYYDAISLVYSFATYKFTWSDGTVEEFQLPLDGQTQYHGVEINCGIGMDPIANPWKVGVNSMPVTFGELTDSLDVEIKANDVASIELLDPGVETYMLGDPDYFANTEEGWIMHSCDMTGFKLKVNYIDGTSKTFTEADAGNYKGYFATLDNAIVHGYPAHMPYTAPGAAKIYISYKGFVDDYEVKLVDVAVDDGNLIVPETAVDEALADKQNGTVTLNATTAEENKTTSAKLPVASAEKLVEEEVKQVVVEMDSATVTINADALEEITKAAQDAEGTSITLSVEVKPEEQVSELTEKQKEKLADQKIGLVVTAQLLCNGEPISDFGQTGEVTVSVPFTPAEGTKGEDYVIWYVSDDGVVEPKDTTYANGMLIFTTNHFSDYVAVMNKNEGNTDPAPSDPTPNDPTPIDPTPSEPAPTEPQPTEPAPIEPQPTEPKPTEPAETTKPTEPAKPTNPAVPDTGDDANLAGMIALLAVSGVLLAVVLWLVLLRKKKGNK